MQYFMRGISFFILSLVFLLCRGYTYSCVRVHHKILIYSPATKLNSISSNEQSFAVFKSIKLTDDSNDFNSLEDDVEDIVLSRRNILMVKCFTAFTLSAFLFYLFDDKQRRLPFYAHFSEILPDKYLAQRVLRI